MNTYEVRMTLQIRNILDKIVVRTLETKLVEYIDADDLVDAFKKSQRVKEGMTSEIVELYEDKVSATLDAVVRVIPK